VISKTASLIEKKDYGKRWLRKIFF